MRRIRIRPVLTAVLCSVALFSCAREETDPITVQNQPLTVGFYAGQLTRTVIGDDGLSTDWAEDDHISVWAENEAGGYNLNNKDFCIHGIDGGRAFFTATLLEPMSEGNYTYYALYPRPVSVSGTTALVKLPSRQDGKVSGGADLMLATPVAFHELACLPEVEDHSNMSMAFNHLLHVLRFYIPEGDTSFGGDAIEELIITLPYEAAGDVSVDFKGASEPVLSNGTSTITVECAEPVSNSSADSRDYIAASVFPHASSFSSGDALDIVAYTSTDRYTIDPIWLTARSFLPGHSTPARLSAVDSQPYYRLICKVGNNYLGEAIDFFDIKSGSTSLYSHNNTEGLYRDIVTEEEFLGESYGSWFETLCSTVAAGSATVTFDSPNAIADVPVPASAISVDGHVATIDLGDVPYLLFENFDSARAYEYHDAYYNSAIDISGGLDINNDMDVTGHLLNDYMPDAGWNAARVGLFEGDKIRINVRYQSGAWVVGRYCGRLDTPALARIKSGHSVSVRLEFDYSFYIPEGMETNDTNNEVAYFRLGTHTSSMNSKIDGNNQNSISGTFYTSSNHKSESLQNMSHYSGVVDNIGSTSRFVWWPCTTRNTSKIAANCAYYLYLDNISVSIAN
ncbi:MAG: fimbrillin family protein [Bacteroidales bacterium]|nr:fimbrillin family protein [Bacteroidales bacterium]